jgi:hypothetical protein
MSDKNVEVASGMVVMHPGIGIYRLAMVDSGLFAKKPPRLMLPLTAIEKGPQEKPHGVRSTKGQ